MRYPLLFLIVSCTSTSPDLRLNPAVYYRNDICFTYELDTSRHNEIKPSTKNKILRVFSKIGKKQEVKFCGVGVLPYDDSYDIKIEHTSKLNLLSINTCHREVTTENSDDGFNVKNGVNYFKYNPTMEYGRACPLFVAAYNREGKHGWGIVAFENPRYQLPATLSCNGDTIEYNGVSICQSRYELLQKIEFKEEVVVANPVAGAAERHSECPKLVSKDNKSFEFLMPNRECVYGFVGKESKKWHQFYSVGYEQFVIRE